MSEAPPTAAAGRYAAAARPTFLYLIYALLLWSLPVGLIAAVSPAAAAAIVAAMAAYFRAIPDALYTLFGTAYLGYAVARSWDKAQQPVRELV